MKARLTSEDGGSSHLWWGWGDTPLLRHWRRLQRRHRSHLSSREAHAAAHEAVRATATASQDLVKNATQRSLAALVTVGAALVASADLVLPVSVGRLLILLVAAFLLVLALIAVVIEGPLLALPAKHLAADLEHQHDLLTGEQRTSVANTPSLQSAKRLSMTVRIEVPLLHVVFAGPPDRLRTTRGVRRAVSHHGGPTSRAGTDRFLRSWQAGRKVHGAEQCARCKSSPSRRACSTVAASSRWYVAPLSRWSQRSSASRTSAERKPPPLTHHLQSCRLQHPIAADATTQAQHPAKYYRTRRCKCPSCRAAPAHVTPHDEAHPDLVEARLEYLQERGL